MLINEIKNSDALQKLLAVAGGANGKEAALSICTLGIACTIETINSSKRKDEDWGDGRILCDAS